MPVPGDRRHCPGFRCSLIDAVRGWARAENAACARKQAVMAELFARRTGLDADERELWWVDPEAAVTAELAAAQHISRGLALHQTHRGVALRDRLPKVAALFEARLITDPVAMAAVDAELAARSPAGVHCRPPRPNTPSTRWSTRMIPARCGAAAKPATAGGAVRLAHRSGRLHLPVGPAVCPRRGAVGTPGQ